MGSRVEEYLRRVRERGYSDSLMGMDDEDIEWELSKMEEADRRREAEWQQAQQPTRTVYRPVDPGLKARILRMFGQPYDESAIPKGQEFYLNGWDNGEEEMPELNPGPYVPAPPGKREMKPDLHDTMYNPVTGKITKIMDGGFEIKGWELPGQGPFWRNRVGGNSPSRGEAVRPLSYTTGGNDGGQGTNTAANPYAGGYADGGAYGDMLFGVTGVTPQQPKQYVGADQLKAFGWQNVDDNLVRDLNNVLGKYEITTPARIRHFLAQCAKETTRGKYYTEQDFGDKTYFDRMYEGRRGIGNIYPGDGKKFIGGGAIHITGRDEYQDFADYVGDQKVMEGGAEYVARKYPWVAAGRWWEKNRMNALVDSLKGEDHDTDVDKVTDVVNPGDSDEARQERKDRHREIRGIIKD